MTISKAKLALRVLSRVKPGTPQVVDGFALVTGPCQLFTGATSRGYGRIGYFDHAEGRVIVLQAHRVVWEAKVGPIGEGLVLDHKCKNRTCVNVDHLEEVTVAENTDRAVELVRIRQATATHCANGHPLTKANSYSPKGTAKRRCRKCAAQAAAKYRKGKR